MTSKTPALTVPLPTALLVIDVQSALCAGEHAAFDAAGVIERINGVAERVRAAGGTVVLIQHEALLHGAVVVLPFAASGDFSRCSAFFGFQAEPHDVDSKSQHRVLCQASGLGRWVAVAALHAVGD